jgi:hypothetical protein
MGKRRSKNRKQQAKRQTFLNGIVSGNTNAKGNLTNSAMATIRDVIVGVVVGGAAGAAIGKPALLVGAAITGVGHYKQMPLATILGMGMMASNIIAASKTVNGTEATGIDGMKDRVNTFKESMKERLYLTVILPKKAAVNGMGKTNHYPYPMEQVEGNIHELDMRALDRIEQQIAKSGQDFQSQVHGFLGSAELSDEVNY